MDNALAAQLTMRRADGQYQVIYTGKAPCTITLVSGGATRSVKLSGAGEITVDENS